MQLVVLPLAEALKEGSFYLTSGGCSLPQEEAQTLNLGVHPTYALLQFAWFGHLRFDVPNS